MMKNKEQLHVAHVSSAEEILQNLPDISRNGTATHYVSLSVSTPEISVNPFHLEGVDPKDIKNRLIGEAVEALEMPANAIEVDYRLFDSDEDQARGVYVCYPKAILKDYLKKVDESGYIPVKLIPTILAGIDSFLDQYKDCEGRFCLFDFSQSDRIYFAVFSNGHCDYLREIVHENDDEVEHEVIQSLRSACAMSHIKKFDQIYFSGNVPHKDDVIKKVKNMFCENVTHGFFTNVEASLRKSENTFAMNLIKDKTFSLGERNIIKKIMLGGVAVCLLVVLGLGINIALNKSKISELQKQYNESDYKYALDLQKRLSEVK